MTVKILIKRHVMQEHEIELNVLLKKLRSMTMNQPGYVSGETLRRLDKSDTCLVISTWKSAEEWNNWYHSEQRMAIQTEIDMLLGKDTEYEVYG